MVAKCRLAQLIALTPRNVQTIALEVARLEGEDRRQWRIQTKGLANLRLTRSRSSKNSMNSATSQHPTTAIAIDARPQFIG